MDMKTVGLIGAVAGLATIGVAHAAIPPAPGASDALAVSSYADLLAPVPDAVTQVKADDAARARRPTPEGELQLAEYLRTTTARRRPITTTITITITTIRPIGTITIITTTLSSVFPAWAAW